MNTPTISHTLAYETKYKWTDRYEQEVYTVKKIYIDRSGRESPIYEIASIVIGSPKEFNKVKEVEKQCEVFCH